jgi:hypothetical protein
MNDVTSVEPGSPTAPPVSPTTSPSSDGSSTAASSTPKPQHKWSGLNYEQVPGLANRIISRYLRGQRKNMERFFKERGLHDSAERMRQIRLSRQGMLAKNRMFQEVLGEYAQRASAPGAQEAAAAGEAAHQEAAADADLGVPAPVSGGPVPAGNGPDTDVGVPELAAGGEADTGPVIEE